MERQRRVKKRGTNPFLPPLYSSFLGSLTKITSKLPMFGVLAAPNMEKSPSMVYELMNFKK
jgi:hypothetical protein